MKRPFNVPVLATLVCLQSLSFGSDFEQLDLTFQQDIKAVLSEYCYECHSGEVQKGDVDLEQFASVSEVRHDVRVWEKALEMLQLGEMPPAKKPQPEASKREALETWIQGFLKAEGETNSGDPGRVVMRRLNNVEFTNTIRDLTGVPLNPADEFPTDGAAGEGFINAGEALVMSPGLFEKYFTAAKEIASHAVLLPDGFAFSEKNRQGDWIEERLARIRDFYGRYTDASGAEQINLQGVIFDTNGGGRLPIVDYLKATIDERAALKARSTTLEEVAARYALNLRYLTSLWELLQSSESSPVMDPIRARWGSALPGDETALEELVLQIHQWQEALTRFQSVGHMKPWMVPISPLTDQQEFRMKFTGDGDPIFYLISNATSDGGDADAVVWKEPRLVFPGRSDVLLRDVPLIQASLGFRRSEIASSAAEALKAAAEVAAASEQVDRDEIANRHEVNPAILESWLNYLGLGENPDLSIDYLTNRIERVSDRDFVNGLGSPDTPNVTANASGEAVRIPGNLKPHGLVMHPSPTLNIAAGWMSPIHGTVQISGNVTHAHPECGNGVTWALELRRGNLRQRLASGVSQGSSPIPIGPIEDFAVREGDLISLVLGPREGNHACDLTDVELLFKESGETARTWNLAKEVSPDIFAGNPRADSFGNEAVWHFYTEPVSETDAPSLGIPAGSVLAQWQTAGTAEEKAVISNQVEALLQAGPDGASEPNAKLYELLTFFSGPFAQRLSEPMLPSRGESAYGLPASRFEGSDVVTSGTSALAIRLPAEWTKGAEFVTTASLHPSRGQEESVQVRVSLEPPGGNGFVPNAPILASEGSAGRERLESAFAEFRQWFPAALCYPKIVPVDEVITLTVYHREDENLSRLMLNEDEQAELNRLWEELHYIGQDALTMVDALAQLLEYATQDSDPTQFEPLQEPLAKRAAEFQSLLETSELRHVDALLPFAERAYRRPLATEEKQSLRELYSLLRNEDLPHDEAFRLTLARILVAPAFLYRSETPAEGDDPHPVSDWELATRLSYFLWSSMPDAKLREHAAADRLHQPEVLLSEARRLLSDERARALATEFACQWLHLRDFDTLDEKSETAFPEFADLRDDMYEETIRFFIDLFQRDGSVLEMLDADHTFLNETLAQHYGIPGVEGEEWRRVDGVKKYGRGGVLGFATVLSKQAGASRSSPILRGNWILETLLGDRLPNPPPDVPLLPDAQETGLMTMREITERHTQDPDCMSCHQRIDPFGYALEAYDAIGRFRTIDAGGREIDTRTHLKWKDDVTFDGMPGLRDYLLTGRRDEVIHTFCKKLLGYALGRSVLRSDGPLLEQMKRELEANDFRFSAALKPLLLSPQFLSQRGLEATREEEL